MTLSDEFVQTLKLNIAGDVRTDFTTRLLYSTDASLYQIEPLGVVFPRTSDDLVAIVALAAQYRVPILARGSGSSLAGQAIGPALIVDCAKYLNRIIEINPMAGVAIVEPGVVMAALNRETRHHQLQFGPDPASAERATMGGSIANNASGAHSIMYGMAADHLLAANVIFSDGTTAELAPVKISSLDQDFLGNGTRLASLYKAALHIRQTGAETIKQNWPLTWRRASGYNLNYLLPWSPTTPPEWGEAAYPVVPDGHLNLAPLLAGSEGTLAVINRLTVRLVSLPRHSVLGILAFRGIAEACDAAPEILRCQPYAVELIPHDLIRLARSVPAYAPQLKFLDPIRQNGIDPAAILVVEFAGDDPSLLSRQAKMLGQTALVVEAPNIQKQVWGVRKVGLGILASLPGEAKPVAFIEDVAVPVERLGEFVREMERILAAHRTQGNFYAHASAGCLHIRPILNIKTAQGVSNMRSIAEATADLVLHLRGTMSGEHGDGLARSEWLERFFGREGVALFRTLKQAADPHNLLNPGKIIDAPPMDQNLRYGATYQARGWEPVMNYAHQDGMSGAEGLVGGVELCNGAGVCRKSDGMMCPSFQVTQEEMYSTRGRANLLRAMLSGRFENTNLAETAVHKSLDLCLACKGCKAECPSTVDMAKLKYEFMARYYKRHPHRWRDYIFGYIGELSQIAQPFAPLVNWALTQPVFLAIGERWFGLSRQRPFPRFARPAKLRPGKAHIAAEPVLFLGDSFNHYFFPHVEQAAWDVLSSFCQVQSIPLLGAGRTLISKGFLNAAKRHALKLLEAVERLDPGRQIPIIGLEPSEIYTLRDEFLDFFPDDPRAMALAKRALMIDEFFVRPGLDGQPRLRHILKGQSNLSSLPKVLLHGHCYQKAQPPSADGYPTGVMATAAFIEALGYPVSIIDDGCCGMAGAFGYEVEHYDLSIRVGELALFPAIREASQTKEKDFIVVAAGVSCQAQIKDGVDQRSWHPVLLAQETMMRRGPAV
jgi:FAD/FMN-containing dehydrogenase/Fe-S oxidoreductase